MVDGYQLRRAHEMEHTRIIAYHIAATNWNSEKHGRIPDIEKYMPLPTDEAPEEKDKDAEYLYLKEIMRKAEENKLYQ